MKRTKMNPVMKSNLGVITEQLDMMLEEVMEQIRPLATEVGCKYTKEQLMLEGRATMLITALNSLKALEETSEVSPREYEELLIEQGRNPKEVSQHYRGEVAEYHLMHKLDEKACIEALASTILEMLRK